MASIQKIMSKFSLKPVQPHYFVGRSQQIMKILNLGLEKEHLGLVNLRGPQKMGRTSLLNYLIFLAGQSGGITPYSIAFNQTNDKLNCLYFDMRALAGLTAVESKNTFIQTIARLVNNIDFVEGDPPSGFDVVSLVDQMANQEGQRYFLLLDRAEVLLDSQIQEAISAVLGILNDHLQKLGILLSFGTSGELSHHDVIKRTRETDECIESISTLMNLFRNDIELGLLDSSEVDDFLIRGWQIEHTPKVLRRNGPFTTDEVAWLSNLSGRHPYLLNAIGQLAFEEKSINKVLGPDQREKVEKEAEQGQIRNLIQNIVNRMSKEDSSILSEIVHTETVGSAIGGIESQTLINLLGEGLVSKNQDNVVQVPSKIVRNIIIQLASSQKTISNRRLGSTGYSDRTIRFKKEAGSQKSVAISLTPIEAEIMRLLLSSEKDIVPQEDIYQTIWEKASKADTLKLKQRLTQRIKILRDKLKEQTGEEQIESVYGTGYRIIEPERFKVPDKSKKD